MALQNSGTITKGQLRTEFSGPTPSPLSQYYRNGAYVPGSSPPVTNPPIPGFTGCSGGGPGDAQSFNNHANGAKIEGYCQGANKLDHITYDDYFTFLNCGGGGGGKNPAGAWSVGCLPAYNVNSLVITTSACDTINMQGWRETHPNDSRFVFFYTQCRGNHAGNQTTNPPTPGNTVPGTNKNAGVPTSGTIKLSNFYGATK